MKGPFKLTQKGKDVILGNKELHRKVASLIGSHMDYVEDLIKSDRTQRIANNENAINAVLDHTGLITYDVVMKY